MLSAAKISTSNGSVHSYYSADGYYSQNAATNNAANNNIEQENNRTPSSWHGKTAQDFGLKGEVNGKIFDDLTNGILPNGTQMQGKTNEDGEVIRDAGRDLTFSAPKSLSILSEVLDIEDLKDIDQESVKQTLDYIEENYSFTRVKSKNQVTKQLTKNLLFATYTHNTNRNLDPNRHTHCVALNITKRADGTYKTVNFDSIFHDYKHLGLVYRSNLAYNLQKAGFDIEVTNHEHGFFEIRDFPKEVITKFSSRRQEIEKQVAKLGVNSAKAKYISALLTREQKVDVADHVLKDDWNKTLKKELSKIDKSLNLDKVNAKNLGEVFGVRSETKDTKTNNNPAKTAIKSAIKELSERNSIFKEKDLINHSLKNSLGKSTFAHITKEIAKFKEKDLLINTTTIGHKNHLASKESLQTELKIIDFTKNSLKNENNKIPIYEKNELDSFEKDNQPHNYNSLNIGQKEAAKILLTSQHSINAIQGYAGTGKTHMLGIAKELADLKNKSFFGLAPSGVAVKELQSVGIKTKTLQWFLKKYEGVALGRGTKEGLELMKADYKDKMLVVDESSMISSKQMEHLLTIANKFDLKTTLIGDTKQLNAVEAGNPFYQMQKHGLQTALMGDIIRQKNTRLKSAVYDVINASNKQNINKGYIRKAFSKIDNITEIKLDETTKEKDKTQDEKHTRVSNNENMQKIKGLVQLKNKIAKNAADSYCNLPKSQKKDTILLTLSNQSRVQINKEIRKNLIKSGELDKKNEIKKEILINKGVAQELTKNINNYKKGDILRFNKAIKSKQSKNLDIKRDCYYEVFDKDSKSNHVYLMQLKENKQSLSSKIKALFTKTNKTLIFSPKQLNSNQSGVEIYEKEEKSFLIGERINFTRGFIARGINNSLSGHIKNINAKGFTIQTDKGEELHLDHNDNALKHIDYGYAFTANRAQGSTHNNVIAVLESYHPQLTNQKPFYVEISRARQNVSLILDNKEKIIKTLEKETGEKISIVESLEKKKKIEAEKTTNNKQKSTKKDKSNDTKSTKENKPKDRKKSKYLVPQLSKQEIQEHFKQAILKELHGSDLKNLDRAIDTALTHTGKKVYFGEKKKAEIKWYGEAGYVKDYKTGAHFNWGVGKIKFTKDQLTKIEFKELSKEEIAKQEKEKEQEKQKNLAEKKVAEEKLSQKATYKYQNHYPEKNRIKGLDNKYLAKKGLSEYHQHKDLKFRSDGSMIIPVKDIHGKIWQLQTIENKEKGSKLFLKAFKDGAGAKMGHFFFFNEKNINKNKQVILAEGFATAASIDKAINRDKPQEHRTPIAVCFDAGNISHSLKNIKTKYPTHNFTIAADDDSIKGGKAGEKAAIQAAQKYGAKVILPTFDHNNLSHKKALSSDFNDLHKIEGIDAVKKQFANENNYRSFKGEVDLGKGHEHSVRNNLITQNHKIELEK